MSLYKSITIILLSIILSPLFSQQLPDSLLLSLEDILKTNSPVAIAECYDNIGFYYSENEQHTEAIKNFKLAGSYYKKAGALKELGKSVFNIGNSYFSLSEFPYALVYFQDALDLFDSTDFKKGIIAAYKSFGLVYDLQEEYTKSFYYYNLALKENVELNDLQEYADIYNNLAIVKIREVEDRLQREFGDFWQDSILQHEYDYLDNSFDSVIFFADSSIYFYNQLDYRPMIALARNTRNQVTLNKGDFYGALEEYNQILNEYSDVLSDYDIGVIKNNMAFCYMRIGNLKGSRQALEESRNIAKVLGYKELFMHYYLRMSDLNILKGNYKNALYDFKTYITYKDSIFNEQKLQAIKDSEVKYETKAKEQEIIALNRENQLKKKTVNILISGLVLITIFLAVAIYFWNLIRKQKDKIFGQNRKITDQKDEIEVQKEAIESSIRSAETIQSAALPSAEKVKRMLPNSFVLFRPRDVVSGDFYWISEENNRIYVLTADCEGHGVPGAFLSMMGFALISEMIALYPEQNAAFILNMLRDKFIESLSQVGESASSSQTMDVSFYILNEEKTIIDFAGAKNPLYLLRGSEIIKYRGDNIPIGAHPNSDKSFTNHEINLKSGDTIFTFSDGFWDQFGGEKGKKYMKGRFPVLLKSTAGLSISETELRINDELDSWQGDNDQNDDILVIGVRI